MGTHNIGTPASIIINGAKLIWDAGFGSKYSALFDKKQAYVDSEVLRYDSPLVPFQTGNLERSGTLGTDIGSGEVEYIADYAAYQYYNTADSRSYDSSRGAHWFERMKAQHKDDILRGAQKI